MNRTTKPLTSSYRMTADGAKLSLAASAGCFLTAGVGYVLNHSVSAAICVEGLMVVGGFYFAIAAVEHFRARWSEPTAGHQGGEAAVESKPKGKRS
jgi:hypothetical protein